jgi:hypothetical protein
MEGETSLLAKLRQMEEHARALTGELPAGHAQNRARLIWGLASHLTLKLELEHEQLRVGARDETGTRPSDSLND